MEIKSKMNSRISTYILNFAKNGGFINIHEE